jgi:regulatory protein
VPLLTGLAPDPRHPGYRVVVLDRGRFASLPAEALAPLGLALGEEVPAAALARLEELAATEAAWGAACAALARRAYARLDLRRRLLKKRHPPDAVDEALGRLEAQGLIDDAGLAAQYASMRFARGCGSARIIRDLLTQGVDRRVAERAVRRAVVAEGIDLEAEARAVAAKRARQLADLPAAVRERRLVTFLARRGYAGAATRQLVQEVLRG